MNDFRIALRQGVQKPGFALTVVCTLGLTIGATTAVFSVVNVVDLGRGALVSTAVIQDRW